MIPGSLSPSSYSVHRLAGDAHPSAVAKVHGEGAIVVVFVFSPFAAEAFSVKMQRDDVVMALHTPQLNLV
jgi:hypothetical protein